MLAKTRLQVYRKRAKAAESGSKEEQEASEANMVTIWEDSMRKEGARGLYQGLEAQLLKGFVSQGVTMMVKQRYAEPDVCQRRKHVSDIGSRVELLIVALYLRQLRRSSL